ncbi:MAG: hypothetical protein IPN86_00810 [Saprospiraceae bacterium]|nr:hypothetical protein [Saprospiraceae bacterium]
MNSIIGLGKYLFAIPMAVFGIMHFMAAGDMAAMAPGWCGYGIFHRYSSFGCGSKHHYW